MRRSNPPTKRWLWAAALLLLPLSCTSYPPEEEAQFDPVLCTSSAPAANPTQSSEAPCGDVLAHQAVIAQLDANVDLDEASDADLGPSWTPRAAIVDTKIGHRGHPGDNPILISAL